MKKRLTMFLACLFLSLGMAMAQTHVTGVVISAEDDQPVIGAFIKVLGTSNGTQTDVDGKFELNVPAGAMLEFSYVGMTPKKVKATANMRVVLESENKNLGRSHNCSLWYTEKISIYGFCCRCKIR